MRWALLAAFVGAAVAASVLERDAPALEVRLGAARVAAPTGQEAARRFFAQAEVRVRRACSSLTMEPHAPLSVDGRRVAGEAYVDELVDPYLQTTEPRDLRFRLSGWALPRERVELRLRATCDDGDGNVLRAADTVVLAVPGARPRPLRTALVTRRDERPAAAALAPSGALVEVTRWSGPQTEPGQLVVRWQRLVRERSGEVETQRAAFVWRGRRERAKTAWRLVYRMGAPEYSYLDAATGDATGDGYPELLLSVEQGSGACGQRRVLRRTASDVDVVFRRWSCDTGYRLRGDRLVVDQGWYVDHDSHCCPTFTRSTAFRWNGRRFVAAAAGLFWNCPEHRCLRWRNGPLRFRPRLASFWDRRRGVAVGGSRPWLIGRTRDGGRSWEIVDASAVPVGRPVVWGRRSAAIRLLRCLRRCGVVAQTRDGGATWTGTS